MGRNSKFDKDAAIDRIMQLMWRDGYGSWSVKAISEELGITRSSFYNAFGSRESLFMSALEHYFAQAPDKTLETLDDSDPILEKITRLFMDVCDIRANDAQRKGCFAVNSVAELVGVDENLGPALEAGINHSISRYHQLLSLAANNGEISREGLEDKALALQNILLGISVMAKIVTDAEKLKASTRVLLVGIGVYKEAA